MEKNSLLPFFEVLSSKINSCLLPKNTISRLGFCLSNLSHSAKIGLMFFFFLATINSFAQTSPADCKLGCTSNDVQIQNAYLSDASGNKLPSNFVCPATGSAKVWLTLELTTKTPRIGVVIYTNIKSFTPPSTIGSLITTFSECFGKNLNQPTNKVTFSQTFNWTCGTSIVLTDVFIGWGTGNTNFCTGTSFQCPATSSKCYALPLGQYIAVQTPVANTASASKCSTQPNGSTAVFDLTSLNSTVIGSQTNVNVTWYSDSSLANLIAPATSYTSSSGNVYAKVTSTISPFPYSTSIVSLTVNPTPAVSSSTTGSLCSGVAQNYDITSAVGGTTYSWSRAAIAGISNTAVSGQTSDPITETLTNTISAPVDVIYLITPTANGCTGATFTYTVTVNPTPAVSSAATGSICSGVAQNYDITSAVGGTTYSWARAAVTGISNIAVSNQTSDPITETLINTTSAPVDVIYLIAPAANGCTGATFTYTVTVNPTPAVSSAATGSVCSGIAQNYNITSAVGGTTYSWSRAAVTGISNVAVSNQTNNPITETLTNTTSGPVDVIYLIAPAANGCTGATFTYTVTVNPNPSADAGTAPTAQCSIDGEGNDFSLSGSFGNGTGLWTVQSATGSAAGSITNGGTTASPTVNVTGVGTVTFLLTVTSNKTPSCGNATSTVIVTVNANPIVNAGTDFIKTCTSNVSGKAIGETEDVTATYLWSPTEGLSSSTVSNPTANPSTTTVYTVIKTNIATGCSGTDSVTVTVNAAIPNAPTFCAVQPSLCSSSGSLTILSPASGTGYEYSIDNGDNWQTSTVFSGLGAGSVSGIRVKNTSSGCISDPADCEGSNCQSPAKIANPEAEKTSSVIVPVEEKTTISKTESEGFDAYPVPFKDQLTIKYNFDYVSDVKIEVFNAQGISVFSTNDTNSYLNKEITLNLDSNSGREQVYLVKVTTNRGSSTKKVLSSK